MKPHVKSQLRHFILASQSPRRKYLLDLAGFKFDCFSSEISEIPNKNLSLDDQISEIARLKLEATCKVIPSELLQRSIVLAADTMVCVDGLALGKPASTEEAFMTLKSLSNRSHEVKTAHILYDGVTQNTVSHIETTQVYFKNLTDDEIRVYIATGEPLDKAGSYAIQGLGRVFIQRFVGDYFNVVGLSVKWVIQLMKSLDVETSLKSGSFLDVQYHLNESNLLSNSDKKLLSEVEQKKIAPPSQLLAVSKLQDFEKIHFFYELGQRHFGENYVQEALDKIAQAEALNLNIDWHLIGPLQKNKVKYIKNKFKYIHSVDSLELAQLINEKCHQLNQELLKEQRPSYKQKIFLQINLSSEKTKSGIEIHTSRKENSIQDAKLQNSNSELDLEVLISKLHKLSYLELVGFMCMPPLQNEPEQNRHYFKKLNELSQKYQLTELSMGTSHDYLVALEEGATWIRLGSTLFGERKK